ncbi:hypothetical protein I79_003070 [Cricetulus griseus]|nr:hypothetical protein I79_003070 [Cricetulus griseus]ERE80292.1 hypothetical protein H671_3g8963 [Cricetulus griseus]
MRACVLGKAGACSERAAVIAASSLLRPAALAGPRQFRAPARRLCACQVPARTSPLPAASVEPLAGTASVLCSLADPRFPPAEVRPVPRPWGQTALGTPRVDNAKSRGFGGKRVFVNASSFPTICTCFKYYSKRDTHS